MSEKVAGLQPAIFFWILPRALPWAIQFQPFRLVTGDFLSQIWAIQFQPFRLVTGDFLSQIWAIQFQPFRLVTGDFLSQIWAIQFQPFRLVIDFLSQIFMPKYSLKGCDVIAQGNALGKIQKEIAGCKPATFSFATHSSLITYHSSLSL